ncbi:gastrula zinc finger protein XlCGF57.1-like [Maniola hyperantus]|uniref:gastrula zinc finger protein XlCGF57.1-like n=1 Tax=Aphantopus hyperantus TaxID=2795564 RepID=UPI002144898E
MQCCVPSCKNTSDNVSTSHGEGKAVSFHGFPSEVHLRAAWLRALGKQDSHLPDCAVVCSQHFLNDEIYETESGGRQIITGAIPSTVQVCMICLDTDSKLFLISKHKLEEAYEKLTGHPLCDQGNLKQTLCVQCAQRLMNFSRFRDKSLRARALMMNLVEKHELITRQHIEMINCTKLQLKSNLVLTTLGPDHCELHILEHPSEDKQTELEETGLREFVKAEGRVDDEESMWVDEDMEMKNEDNSNIHSFVQDPLKYERCVFQCTYCLEDFVHEHAYMQHMSMHLQDNKVPSTEEANIDDRCGHNTLATTQEAVSSCVRQDIVSIDISYKATFQNSTEYAGTSEEKVTSSNTVYTCDFCQRVFKQKSLLAEHIRSHVSLNRFTCKTCQYQPKDKNHLMVHMRTHTGDKPFCCKLCEYKCKRNSDLVKHVRTHTSDKPLCCKLCNYKCNRNYDLVRHMKTHTGEKPFCCNLCTYKSNQNCDLVKHMRIHTGEKPFCCKLCEYKCSQTGALVVHMRTHTGEKPYCCKFCEYKCSQNSLLVVHMRTHTGERPFCCKLCKYKFNKKVDLERHMSTHTGEKPFCCKLCEYKCNRNSGLVRHMRTHTGEKPFCCKLCKYKSSDSSGLVKHMRTHR